MQRPSGRNIPRALKEEGGRKEWVEEEVRERPGLGLLHSETEIMEGLWAEEKHKQTCF